MVFDLDYQRKLEINEWIISARWFYMVAVFLIGILGNSIINIFEAKPTFFPLGLFLLVFLIVNTYFYKALEMVRKTQSERHLKWLSLSQISLELVIFTIILRMVGDESLASVFFFLPIISASTIFGVRGSVITALISGALVNIALVLEYFDQVFSFLLNINDYSELEFMAIKNTTINIIKTIVTSNFYIVIALVSGYSNKLIFRREKKLIEEAEKLNREKQAGADMVSKLDKAAQELVERDRKLKNVNLELSQKINELKQSEKSIIRAFADLQEARKRADNERNKTLAIISNFIDPIIVIDNNNKINLINPAAKEIFGFQDDDLGREVKAENNYTMDNFRDIIQSEYTVKTSKELKSNNPNEEEVVLMMNNQELTYKVITAKVVDKKKEDIGVMKIFYNLTREKMIDKLKSEFISIAAHQLRTPLSAIKWVIKMVLDGDAGKLNDEQLKLLTKGYQSNERIINLVNDMLNVSRIEEGRFGYTFEQNDITEIIKAQADNVESLLDKKHIKLELHIPEKLPKIYMDRAKMDLVVQNLVENAVKYTPEHGKIEVAVEAGNSFLTVRVKDNGVGIPEKDKAKLFSKFFRAENVVRLQTEGSGLGLFIVKNIVKRHGGDITVQSEEGKGTEFTFTIPFKES